MKNKSSNQLWWKIGIFLLIAIYFITHLTSLNLLPVFADESIYIRWSQLIIDDWKRYLFFAMNDGKTPLFVWLTTIALKFWNDPLIAGRMISVIAGIFQICQDMAAFLPQSVPSKSATITLCLWSHQN